MNQIIKDYEKGELNNILIQFKSIKEQSTEKMNQIKDELNGYLDIEPNRKMLDKYIGMIR